MAISQRVTWTLMPNGAKDATTLRASVFISPRLSIAMADAGPGGQPDLSHFPDWLNWPERIAHARFSVRIGGTTVEATRVSDDPRQDVWQALFPGSTIVQPYDFAGSDFSGKAVLSYPIATIYKNVRSLYGQLAATSSDTPTIDKLGFLLVQTREYRDRINGRLAQPGNPFDIVRPRVFNPTVAPPPPLDRTDLFTALDLHSLYFRPLNQEVDGQYLKKTGATPPDIHENVRWRAYNTVDLPTAQDLADAIDFHRIVASLGQYPALLRATGLVVDLEFPRPPTDGDTTIQVGIDWHHDASVQTDPDLRPRLRTTLNGASFAATPRDYTKTAIVDRYLRLSHAGAQFYPIPLYFDLVEMDVDGAGMKLKNFLLGWQQAANAISYDDETDVSVQPAEITAPSLRSGGLTLANRARNTDVSGLFARNKALDSLSAAGINSGSGDPASDPGLMSAEDVVRGYRADVFDFTRKLWFSLNTRDVTFTFVNDATLTLTVPAEEGMARLAAATSSDGSNADIVKVHEGMFTWRGWSLTAPEPGKSLLAKIDPSADTTNPDNVVGPGEAEVPDGLPMKTSFEATDLTLPSLRFGRIYSVRVRLADLAGNSLPFTAKDIPTADAISAPVVYRRYEPVESPALALVRGSGGLEAPAEGESMGRAAIRTFNDTPAKNTIAIPDRARRHIVPPRVTHRFAELHGVMDTHEGKVDPTIFGTLQAKDVALDEEAVPTVDDPSVTVTYAAADEGFTLPYLPDPIAIGVAFKVGGLPGVDPEKVYPVSYYPATGFSYDLAKRPDWPNAQPFTIVISENGPVEPAFDKASREFRITLKKGERARVRVSSILPQIAIPAMAVWQMFMDRNPSPADITSVGTDVATGQHWMFTPWRVIELVHATQKPLITPAVKQPITVDRDLGSIKAVPTMVLALHAKSTAKIDVNATWVEPNDDPTALVPLPNGYSGNKPRYPGPGTSGSLTPADPGVINHATRAFEIKLARLATPNNVYTVGGPKSPVDPVDKRPQHVFGDTHYRRVTYQIDATTRFREFMPAAIAADPGQITVSSPDADPAAIAWIPNAAPPPPPKLLYVVPTFGWGHSGGGGQFRSWRGGGGIRVYLDRPWFTTGFTEMLGVVLPPGPVFHNWAAYGEAQALPPFVTQWGADPVWVSGRVQTVAPQPSAFPLAKWRAPITFDGTPFPADEGSKLPPGDFPVAGLRTPEMLETPDVDPASPGELAVAPHAIGYDAERQLWYADIVVRPGDAYFPFIRLALARYNPVSVQGAHLSSVVMAEFVQLTPDRLAIVTQNGDSAHVSIYGTGAHPSSNAGPISGLFELAIETLAPGADPDLGWRRAADVDPVNGVANPSADPSPPPILNSGSSFNRPAPNATVVSPATTATTLLSTGNYAALLRQPNLLAAVAPPFLWQGDIAVPSESPGTRVRLVITESEVFQTGERNDNTMPLSGSRVVYVETFELSPQAPPPPTTPPPAIVPPIYTPPQQVPPIFRLPRNTTPAPATTQPPRVPPVFRLPPIQQLPVASFAGEWDATRGRLGGYHWHLEQNGNAVTGTYAQQNGSSNATVDGVVDLQGRFNFTWNEQTLRGASASGRGYLDLISPDEWQGRWWIGDSPTDPTPTQPLTWHGTRTPPPTTLPILRTLPNLKLKLR